VKRRSRSGRRRQIPELKEKEDIYVKMLRKNQRLCKVDLYPYNDPSE
jgi:hypothetical protein